MKKTPLQVVFIFIRTPTRASRKYTKEKFCYNYKIVLISIYADNKSMKKKRNILLVSLFFILSYTTFAFVGGRVEDDLRAFSTEAQNACVHHGFHYAGHENSLIKNGNKEFWACCKCHNMYFSRPSGTWVDKSQYDYDLKDTAAFLPSVARDIGNLSHATNYVGTLDGYAFDGYYSYSGYAQGILSENINISRYQKVTFAFKSESLWFIVQDPSWTNSLPYGRWYQIVLDQSSPNTWDISVIKLEDGTVSRSTSYSGSDLKTIVGLGSDTGNFYITNVMAYYKQTELMGTKVDECVYSANGIQTYDTYELVPSGFEQVHVTSSKTSDGSFFSGEYYSAFDLSSYSKVKFALKTMGYFLCNHLWNSYVCGTSDWLIFELTKTGAYTWDLVVTNFKGETYYTEEGLSGDMGANLGVYTSNSLNAILYGKPSGFYAAKKNGVDLKVYATEVRAYSSITLDNNYKIIYQGDDRNAWKASQDLFDRIGRVSSWSIYLVPQEAASEVYSSSSKIISIGDTNYARTAGVTADSNMGPDGYAIVSKGKSIIVVGNSSRAMMPAIRMLLEKAFDFDCFAHSSTDMVTTYKTTSTIEIEPLSIYRRSSIGIRQITADDDTLSGGYRLSLGYSYDNNGGGHVTSDVHTLSSQFLSYDTFNSSHYRWFRKSGSDIQLCYSARGNSSEYNAMKQQLVSEITPLIENFEGKTVYVDLSIRDNWYQCNCSSCQNEIAHYDSYGAQILHFVSEVADLVDAWVEANTINKTVRYLTLAYQQAQEPPTTLDYTLNPHVITYFASPKADFSLPYNQGDNKQYYDQLVGWSNLYNSLGYNDNLWFWVYGNQTQCYMYPYNDFEMTQPLIQLLSNLGVSSVHMETPFVTRTPCFEDLNIYVKGKLLNDCNIDYDATVDKFMEYYYGPAASNMKLYYEQIKGVIQANVDGTIFGEANKKEYWTIATVTSMISKLDSCLQDVSSIEDQDTREAYSERIHRERITPIFILLEHYVNSHTYSKSQMTDYLNEFKTYTTKYGITYFNHNTSLSGRITSFTNAVNALTY